MLYEIPLMINIVLYLTNEDNKLSFSCEIFISRSSSPVPIEFQ
jgi:hypothetical protein